jgi:hypothetical protein
MNTNIIYKPKKDIEEYFDNDFNIEIYEELTDDPDWQGTFEPLFFLNLLYQEFEIAIKNRSKPMSFAKRISNLNLTDRQQYYFLSVLIELISEFNSDVFKSEGKNMDIFLKFLDKELQKLDTTLFPKEKKQEEVRNPFDFEKVKDDLDKIKNIDKKIEFLEDIKTEYLQKRDPLAVNFREVSFDEKCDLEIKKYRERYTKKTENISNSNKTNFKLSDKKGARIDLIRICNALYNLRLIEKDDGQIPSKKEFMENIGEFFGEDFSKYHSNLSQAKQNYSIEANIKVFERMIELVKKELS